MIHDSRGVIDMPVKLAVCFLILGLMVPVVMEATEDADREMSLYDLRARASDLEDAIHRAYSDGSVVTLGMDIPYGQCLEVGGEGVDSHLMRLIADGREVETRFIDDPTVAVIGPEVVLSGNCTVVIDGRTDRDEGPGVRVSVL